MGTGTFFLFCLFAGLETLVLLPSLNASSPQNVSLEDETWPDHFHQPSAGGEKELKWEKEPTSQITVTLKQDEKVDDVHRQNIKLEEHQIPNGAEEEKQSESSKERRGHGEGQDIVEEENKTRNEVQIQEENQVYASLATVSPSQDLPSITVPSFITISISTHPSDMTYEHLSNTPPPQNKTSMTSISEIRMSNSSMGQTESSKVKLDVAGMTEETKAGSTALSLPSTFNPKPKTSFPKIKYKRIAKPKKTSPQKKVKKMKKKSKKNATQAVKQFKAKNDQLTSAPYIPYFKDNYCPPDCACYGRVVQCSDKELENFPYGIPFNSRYILLMNNHIKSIPLDLLSEYLSLEFLVLSNNHLLDSSIESAFDGIQALKRLYLDRNLLQSIPTDLPASLEELRLDGNKVKGISEVAWFHCPSLFILSLNNNSLESTSASFPVGVFSSLTNLRTLSLSHNHLTTVPFHLPLSLRELYLRGNLIQRFPAGVFQGKAQLQVLDLSANRLTNKVLGKDALINATHLESLSLEGNFLKQVPRFLPQSLKTLNLEGNSISSISKTTFLSLPYLEHLGLARNKISKVVPSAFRVLPLLHQLDLSYNMLHQVPRQLPAWLIFISLNHNKIQTIPRDAFCSFKQSKVTKSQLVKVQLEHNLVDLGNLDSVAFSCLRGFQVVHFY